MDLNIHREVIKEPSFKFFLKEKATDLAGRLQVVLAPLWSQPEEIGDSFADCSSTEGSDMIELTEVFRQALEVQCQLIGTCHSYVCIWHAPGARFDPLIMTPQPGASDLDSNAAIVEVTLLPGINRLPRDYPGAGCGSFLDSGCVMQGVGECLVSAVVSLSGVSTA